MDFEQKIAEKKEMSIFTAIFCSSILRTKINPFCGSILTLAPGLRIQEAPKQRPRHPAVRHRPVHLPGQQGPRGLHPGRAGQGGGEEQGLAGGVHWSQSAKTVPVTSEAAAISNISETAPILS